MNIVPLANRLQQAFNLAPASRSLSRSVAFSAAVVAAACASSAYAVPVLSTAANITVPATTAGIYINVVSGASGGSTTTGWDINPWGTGNLFIYAGTGGGLVNSANSSVASLAAGAVIGAGSTFSTTAPAAITFGALSGQWTLNATNYFGFRFVGDDTLVHYGYGTMIVGATNLVRTVGQLWYESVPGAAITIPGAVPEPASAAYLLMGLGVGGFMLRRQRRSSNA